MAHRLNWSRGQRGKGLVLRNGDVHTWRVGELGDPQHGVYWSQHNLGIQPAACFDVDPTGGLHQQDRVLDNITLDKAVAADPNLYLRENEEDWSLDPDWKRDDPKPGTDYNFVLHSSAEDESQYATMLKEWLDGLPGIEEAQPLTIHHESPLDIASEAAPSPSAATALYPPGHEPDYMKQSGEAVTGAKKSSLFARIFRR